MSVTDPPHRRLRLTLDLEADDLTSLTGALEALATNLLIADRESIPDYASGGYHSGFSYKLTCDPDQTGDRFRDQLAAWSEQRRAARVAAG